ncbi:MAG: putative pyridoxal phosphate-dependent enzyme apparently involved in regulation of cell wall [Thermoleophilia bacterium]|nr:putative pyridoxal phosphate-dependent enzyme apparently involved in regulation of cell wall [Thermoleophilia bacterium]
MDVSAPTSRTTAVPFVDLSHAHAAIKHDLLQAVANLVDSGQFVNGPQVAELEAEFAAWCGASHCVGTASGLDALRLGLLASGLESDDQVIVPAMTFVATAEAVTQAGGRAVLADISDADWNLDPAAAEAAVTERTRFLLPVHLYGQMADVTALAAVAARHDLDVIEDACQAHGASRDGVRSGTAGRTAAFSFYPGKNLGAMGDAGALLTADATIAESVRMLREHGQRRKYDHDAEGWTARLDTIQAIVLLLKLPHLSEWNEERRRAAAKYTEGLTGVGDLVLAPVPSRSNPVWHLYVIRTAEPDLLAEFLAGRGIATGRHYPFAVHLTRAYAYLGYREGAFPVAEALARECLSLPIFPGITEAQVAAVIDGVHDFFAHGR